MGLCESCKNNSCGYASEDVIRCGDFEENLVQTNADRIRAMSDEELAVFLADEIPHGDCYGCEFLCWKISKGNFANSCQNAWYGWLKQPAKGE